MRFKAFCLYDNKTAHYHPPFFMHHLGAAVRACCELGTDLNTQVGRYPHDFVLVEIGEYDDQAGVLLAAPQIVHASVGQLVDKMRSAARMPLFAAADQALSPQPAADKEAAE